MFRLGLSKKLDAFIDLICLSCIREDHQLLCWHLEGGIARASTIVEFPIGFYPTDMQWHPRPAQGTTTSVKKQSLDILLITTADGKKFLLPL